MKKILLPLLLCASITAGARQYWTLDPTGNAIVWNVDSTSYGHTDHIEMAGKHIATVLRYGVNNDGSFGIDKSLVFPMLRTIPNNTHASFQRRVTHDIVRDMMIGRNPMKETVNEYWMDHIDAMQDLRQGIRLQAYAQSNPVDAYKRESLHMFEEMISAIQDETVRRLYSVRLRTNEEVKRERVATGITEGRGDGTVKKQPRKVQKVGRNDPCPCGSGKKYKNCCGRDE